MSTPVALITGGGSGIGLAVAEHLIRFHGFKVAIADIVQERVTEQASRLGSDSCLALHLDVTDYDSLCKAFVQTFECILGVTVRGHNNVDQDGLRRTNPH